MESRLKERLTGAAILVALIVLVVPEIFHGRHSGATATRPPAGGIATRTYTIELGSSPAAPAVVPAPAAAPALAPALAPVLTPAPKARRAASAVPAAPTTPRASGAAAPAPALQRVSSAPPALEGAAHRQGHGGGGWTVQLGLFAKEGNAQRLAHTAQSRGIEVDVTRYGARGLYRVAVADLADRAAAEQVSHRLHGAGLPAAILGPR